MQESDGKRYAIKIASAGVAGMVGTTAIFPVDLIKTRLQISPVPVSPWTMARQVVQQGGFRSLYKGLSATLVGVTPEKAIKLVVNDGVREWMAKRSSIPSDQLPLHYGAVAGGCAGLAQFIITCPMETIKIRMQIAPHRQSLSTLIPQLGLRGVYKGGCSTILRDLPFSMLIFQLNATFRRVLATRGHDHFGAHLAAGMVAGGVAAFAATPLDVIKTRIQSGRAEGIREALGQTIQERGLFRGATQRVLIVSPLFGIALAMYELQQRLFMTC